MAIGARPFHVLYAVSSDTLFAAAVGLLLGLVAARFGSALLERLTYGVDVRTWTTGFAAAGVMLVLVALSVGLAARRALRIPVIAALRQE
jgi:ABC-type antimicrobial peptide transport system permease subunit